jgi:hypothetical protein
LSPKDLCRFFRISPTAISSHRAVGKTVPAKLKKPRSIDSCIAPTQWLVRPGGICLGPRSKLKGELTAPHWNRGCFKTRNPQRFHSLYSGGRKFLGQSQVYDRLFEGRVHKLSMFGHRILRNVGRECNTLKPLFPWARMHMQICSFRKRTNSATGPTSAKYRIH